MTAGISAVSSEVQPRSDSTSLLGRTLDGWILGGFGLVVWVAAHGYGPDFLDGRVVWLGLALTAPLGTAHLGYSYYLAYGPMGPPIKQHPFSLILAPAVLAAFTIYVVWQIGIGNDASGVLEPVLRLLFVATGWHYIKQVYGIAMISLRARGIKPSKNDILVLRYGLYPLWAVDAMLVLGSNERASYGRYDVDIGIVPASLETLSYLVAALAGGWILATLIGLFGGLKALPALAVAGAYLTGFLWILHRPPGIQATALFASVHALQHLWCSADVTSGYVKKKFESESVVRIVTIAVIVGLSSYLLLISIPNAASSTSALAGIGIALFAATNLFHYAVDAVIWRRNSPTVSLMSHNSR